MRAALLVIAAILASAVGGCGNETPGPTDVAGQVSPTPVHRASGTPQQSIVQAPPATMAPTMRMPTTPPVAGGSRQEGYLARDSNRVVFIQWTEVGGNLSGQVQVVYVADRNARGIRTDPLRPQTDNASFTGLRSGSSVSLSIVEQSGAPSTWTGSVIGTTLTLVIPDDTGLLTTTAFQRGTVDDYNRAVLGFRQDKARIRLSNALASLKQNADQLTRERVTDNDLAKFDADLTAREAAFRVPCTVLRQFSETYTWLLSKSNSAAAIVSKVNNDVGDVNQALQELPSEANSRDLMNALSNAQQLTAMATTMREAVDRRIRETPGLNSIKLDECGQAAAMGIAVGTTVSVVGSIDCLNLRSEPGMSAAILRCMPRGEMSIIADGPRLADGHTWWRLTTSSGIGWAWGSYLQPVSR